MSTTFQIIFEERVYIYTRRILEFDAVIGKAYRLLQGTSKGASAFDALHQGIATKWIMRDDVVKPFGDKRQLLKFVCSFNLDQDVLYYSDESGHIQLPLDRLRKPPQPRRQEFTPFEIVTPPQLDLAEFLPPYHSPSTPISARRLAFLSRILSDFAEQWRHMLRSSYTESTFRRLAKAIVSLATCDFRVDEAFTSQHTPFRGPYVNVLDVPTWEPCDRHLFNIRGATVIIHQDLKIAREIAKNEAKKISTVIDPDNLTKQRTYLLLSVRYILVCRVDSVGNLLYTAPTAFMDGLTPPSPSAIHLLLQALSLSQPPLNTPIHNLPLEIQDRILEHVSEGPVEASRLGCVLSLGSPFTWMRAIDWSRRGGPIEIHPSHSHRYEVTPVESKIYFGDVFSGISYK